MKTISANYKYFKCEENINYFFFPRSTILSCSVEMFRAQIYHLKLYLKNSVPTQINMFKWNEMQKVSWNRSSSWFINNNKKPSALRFAFSACLFYNKQNFYCWTISFGKREWFLLALFLVSSQWPYDLRS